MAKGRIAITEQNNGAVTWVNVTHPGARELAALEKRFGFLPNDLQECPPPLQRPKLVERPSYLFMVLLFPHYDRRSKRVRPIEIDFFITPDTIVTVHGNELPLVAERFALLAKSKRDRQKFLGARPAELLYNVLHELLKSCFPMLVHMANDVDDIEAQMSEVHNRDSIREIFRLKMNIVNFKKSMQPHKAVIRKLISSAPTYLPTDELISYFQNLIDHTKEIWDGLAVSEQTLDAIETSHLSLLNFRANDTIRVLTLAAAVVLPLTLVTTIFGMNTHFTPLIGTPYDFWIIIAGMVIVLLALLGYFKWKRWL